MLRLKIACIKIRTYREIRWFHVNSSTPSAAYMRGWTGSSLVQVMASRLFSAPLPEPMVTYCQLDPRKNVILIFSFKENVVEKVVCELAAILNLIPVCWNGGIPLSSTTQKNENRVHILGHNLMVVILIMLWEISEDVLRYATLKIKLQTDDIIKFITAACTVWQRHKYLIYHLLASIFH